jgi:hypothetical protein
MHKNRAAWLALVLFTAGTTLAQVVTPAEIKEPELRSLQQQYMDDLKVVGQDILANKFDYAFYLSRKLDLDETQQQRAEQRSIRFDRYNGETVLAITGNYYAAYPADKINPDQRARSTFLNVVMPILKAAVPRFQSNRHIEGYAVEISHHILGKVMGVSMERPENLMVFLPQSAAIRLLAGKDENTQQAALLKGQVFLNAEPVTIWLNGQGPQLAASAPPAEASADAPTGPAQVGVEVVRGGSSDGPQLAATPAATGFSKPKDVPPSPARDTSPQAVTSLQASHEELLGRIAKELDSQAHLVTYAAPKFIVFRQGIYLEFSINTNLPESASGSRYKLAAMAFDEHIAHLARPTLAYFKDETQFDGISFSTTVHLTGKAGTSEAVEFFFPFAALRCYAGYDCTGQQLLDAGTVLINGERVALDLQLAEGGANR